MWRMDERPEQRPEGALIAAALKRSRMSQRQAAAKAGISENRLRAIVHGYQTVSAGTYAPVRGPADTVARIANVAGVTPDQLEEAGRGDAAEELRALAQTHRSGTGTTRVEIDVRGSGYRSDIPSDEELRASALQPETVEAIIAMRRRIARLIAEKDETQIRRLDRVTEALDEDRDAG